MKDYINTIYNNLKQSAKKRGISFELTKQDLDDIGLPLRCPVFGIELRFNNGKVEDDSYSFDRIDSSKGYTRDNLVVISYKANRLKSNATLEELKMLYEYYDYLEESRNYPSQLVQPPDNEVLALTPAELLT